MRHYIIGFLSCLALIACTAAVKQITIPARAEVVAAQSAELDAAHVYLAAVRDGKPKKDQDAAWEALVAAKDARKDKAAKPK